MQSETPRGELGRWPTSRPRCANNSPGTTPQRSTVSEGEDRSVLGKTFPTGRKSQLTDVRADPYLPAQLNHVRALSRHTARDRSSTVRLHAVPFTLRGRRDVATSRRSLARSLTRGCPRSCCHSPSRGAGILRDA